MRVPRRVGHAPEMKFFQTTASTGVLSQYTWQTADQMNNIAAGTGQGQRLGRQIRVHRVRYALYPSDMAGDTVFAVSNVMRVDPTVSSSDLFPTSGSNRSYFEYPNPLLQTKVFEHTVKTAMQWAGATFGTTPSYASACIVADQSFGKGKLISYDAAGSLVGPSPVLFFCVSETSISIDIGCQIWFTDE